MKIAFKSGFYRLYIVFASLWIGIGICILISSGISFDGLIILLLPPPVILAIGWVCGWVISGFMPTSEPSKPPEERFVSQLLAAYLDEALKWIYVQVSFDLKKDGCEIPPSEMPEDMRSAVVQYLLGATLAMEEDLQDAKGAFEWVVESRLQVLQWILIPVDEARGLIEVRRFNGEEPNHFSSFIALGAAAMRSLIECCRSSEDMKAWAETYQSGFLSSARIFTNYR